MANITNGHMTFIDRKRRPSTVMFTGSRLTAGNFAAQIAAFATLQLAVQGISHGNLKANGLRAYSNEFGVSAPTEEGALREIKWMVHYHDNQEFLDAPTNSISNNGYGKPFTLELPIANPTGRLLVNEDRADLTETAMAAFVSAFEAYQRSPYGGTVVIDYVEIVGA